MKINFDKCLFSQQEVEYLGHILNFTGITMDQSRVQEIREFPRPQRLKALRSFLGLLNYYKKFIPAYSRKTLPLLKLLRKDVKY